MAIAQAPSHWPAVYLGGAAFLLKLDEYLTFFGGAGGGQGEKRKGIRGNFKGERKITVCSESLRESGDS